MPIPLLKYSRCAGVRSGPTPESRWNSPQPNALASAIIQSISRPACPRPRYIGRGERASQSSAWAPAAVHLTRREVVAVQRVAPRQVVDDPKPGHGGGLLVLVERGDQAVAL